MSARGVAVSSTSVVVAPQNLGRTAITFSVGDTANSSSVVLKDLIDATVTNGFPIQNGAGAVRIVGTAATHRWSAIRLAAVDCVVGVIEEFPPAVPVVDPPGPVLAV